MTLNRRTRWWVAIPGAVLLAAGAWWWHDDRSTRFLPAETSAFVATFAAPSPADSPETRRELDELLALQAARSAAEVAAAQADRKTEISRFYAALGFDASSSPKLPRVEQLAERVEDDVRIYVRAAKVHFRRLRPHEIEPRLEPCIENVKGDLSYPSGHAAYGWAMYFLLREMVPERKQELEARAREYAHQRMVCGVHFASDLEAGRLAAGRVIDAMVQVPRFREEFRAAAQEMRAALRLPPIAAESN